MAGLMNACRTIHTL